MVEIVYDFLIEAVQLGSFVVVELGVRPVRLKQTGGERRINALEEFEEYKANGVALWTELIAAPFWEFFDQALSPQFA